MADVDLTSNDGFNANFSSGSEDVSGQTDDGAVHDLVSNLPLEEEYAITPDNASAKQLAPGIEPFAAPPALSGYKSQFISNEDIELILNPFVKDSDGSYVIGTDNATLVVKKPDGTLLSSPPTPSFDGDVNQWKATIPVSEFQEGEWLIYATSDAAGTFPQFLMVWWGDYVDDIPETNQAALGRWKIENNQLTLYEEDGVTVLQAFDLKDDAGNPSETKIFEKDPV